MGKQMHSTAEFIIGLNMNGLQGRMLRLPAPKTKKRDILLVYGHHSSLEKVFGVAEALNDYGSVTAADLPGFGGMQSFYKLGQKPSLDNLADYLAAFIKLRFRGRITIVGVSFGFAVATRMLQHYPELSKKVDLLVSIEGLMHKDEFKLSRPRYLLKKMTLKLLSRRVPAMLFRNLILHPSLLRNYYKRVYDIKANPQKLTPEECQQVIELEINLWRKSDVRTHMETTAGFLGLNNCTQPINLSVWHVWVDLPTGQAVGNKFDELKIEQHMRTVFNDFRAAKAGLKKPPKSVLISKQEAKALIPVALRQVLRKTG